MPRRPPLPLACTLVVAACVPNVGPTVVPNARAEYNAHIAESNRDQLLLNIVRLRYRDIPYFLEVGSVLTQYEVSGQARIGDAGWANTNDRWTALAGVSAQVSERPTITYQPLSGEAFVRRLIAPLPLPSINLLAGSGWSIERLMLCCMDEVNGVRNAPGASGPTPATLVDEPTFREAARLMRRLQLAGAVDFVRPTDSTPTGRIRVRRHRVSGSTEDSLALGRLLGYLDLRPDQDEFLVTPGDDRRPQAFHVYLRSVLGVMFFLSHGIDVPEPHRARGLVTNAVLTTGEPVDWQVVTGGIFRVRSGPTRPDAAYTSVHYRDHWFWIADDDLESKTTFALLGYLLALQSAGTPQSLAPLITVPATP